MAIEFRDAEYAIAAYGSTPTYLDVPVPAGVQDGDLIVLVASIFATSPPTLTPPEGFTLWRDSSAVYNVNQVMRLWYKYADGESGSYRVTSSVAEDSFAVGCVAYGGAKPLWAGFDYRWAGGTQTSYAYNSQAPEPGQDHLLLGLFSSKRLSGFGLAVAIDNPASWNDRIDADNNAGPAATSMSLYLTDGARTADTSPGAWTFSPLGTEGATNFNVMHAILGSSASAVEVADLPITETNHLNSRSSSTVVSGSYFDIGDTSGSYNIAGRGLAKAAFTPNTSGPEIPEGVVFTKAELRLWEYDTGVTAGPPGDGIKRVHRVLRDWVTAQATWNVWKTGSNWSTAGCGSDGSDRVATPSTSLSTSDGTTLGAYRAWPTAEQLVADIQGMFDGDLPNYGWLFAATGNEFLGNSPYRHTKVYGPSNVSQPVTIPLLRVWYLTGPTFDEASIVINDDAASTDDNDVTLTLSCSASQSGDPVPVDQMCFSDDGATWSEWEAYATTRAYQLPAQDDEDPHDCTVYAKFRIVDGENIYDSDVVSDSITLQVDWTGDAIAVNAGAPYALDRDVSVRFRSYSSASSLLNGIPSDYRIRDSGGSWSGWTAYDPTGKKNHGYAVAALTLAGYALRTVEVELRDDDGNTHVLSSSIESIAPGETIEGVAPPLDITNWRLLVGGKDIIDDLEAPPSFSHGQHGPGSLNGQIPTDDPLRHYANEFVAGAEVELWDGPVCLWDGKLKPTAPVSDDESVILIDAAGALDLAKADESHIAVFVDADPEHWHQTQKSYKKYEVSIEDGFRIEHRKKTFADGGKLGSVYYWLYDGRRTDAAAVIDHLVFADSDIDVEAANWYCRWYVSDSPWGSWTAVPAGHNGEWNNETDSGAQRIPSGTDSFADLAADHWPGVAVRAVKCSLLTTSDVDDPGWTNDRWCEFDKPQVFAIPTATRIDQIHAALATEMGYTTDTDTVGAALGDCAFLDEMSRGAMLEEVALRHSAYVEWGWRVGGTFVCRPRPTAPEQRLRYYVLDTHECNWGVVADEDARYDFVCVKYRCKDDATFPNGTVRRLYRPSAPTAFSDRVGLLDLTEGRILVEADAQDAGDQWLDWNNAQAASGEVSGFGAWLKTVDGVWVPASHARNGDWVKALDPADLSDAGPYYITAVEVRAPDDVTLYVGGAELEFAYRKLPLPEKRRKPGPKRRKPKRG